MFSCRQETEPVAPQPQTEGSINTGRCTDPSCNSPVTCTNRMHEICSVCGISRRPPRGCLCGVPDGEGQEGEWGGRPVLMTARPDVDIYLSRANPSQTITFYYSFGVGTNWNPMPGSVKLAPQYPVFSYVDAEDEELGSGKVKVSLREGVSIPQGGVSGGYFIVGHTGDFGRIIIRP